MYSLDVFARCIDIIEMCICSKKDLTFFRWFGDDLQFVLISIFKGFFNSLFRRYYNSILRSDELLIFRTVSSSILFLYTLFRIS